MARLQNGLFGGFSGKIGEVEGYIRNGIPFIRNKKRKIKVPASVKQLSQRRKVALVNKFIGSMTAFVRLGFSVMAKGQRYSANNMAKSYQLKNTLTGEYPDIQIAYESVCLAMGKLIMPGGLAAKWQGNGVLFSWTYDPLLNWDTRRARAMVLVHEPIAQKSYYFLTAACMDEGSQFIELPAEIVNLPVHAYIAFANEEQTEIGNSQYFAVS